MRTHAQIIADAGGHRPLAEKIGQKPERVRFWKLRQSIPPEAWAMLADKRVATLRELAGAVDERQRSEAA